GDIVGPFLDPQTRSKTPRHVWVHENCAAYSPEVSEQNGKWANVVKATRRGNRLLCFACDEKGATVGCFNGRCRHVYHVPCARSVGFVLF
ncbi:unnamed protein product, partial [Laminaria digitata]